MKMMFARSGKTCPSAVSGSASAAASETPPRIPLHPRTTSSPGVCGGSPRLGRASRETWLEDDEGRLPAVITNGERAMVMLMDEAGDPGEHLTDPHGEGRSGGFRLANGQVDAYADRDTVALGVAGEAVAHLVDHGVWPDDATVEDDREPRSQC